MGTLPERSAGQLQKLPPSEAVEYVLQNAGRHRISKAILTRMIRRYREGASVRDLQDELNLADDTVKRWLAIAEKAQVLQVRRNHTVKAEALEKKRLEVERQRLEREQEMLTTDQALAEDLRVKVKMILDSITPGKVTAAKLKDLTDALSKLIAAARLLSNQSTSNTQTQSIVHYIAHINSIPFDEQMKLADKRAREVLPPP